MNARSLMILSAVFLLLLGALTSLFPHAVLAQHGTEPDGATILLIQMMGALYLGFASLNWFARNAMVGLFARPLALGNFVHFAIVTLMLAWEAIDHGVHQLAFSAAVVGVFAVWFGIVLFRRSADSQAC